MFRELVKSVLAYENNGSVVSLKLLDTLKKDIREDVLAAFNLSEPLIEKQKQLFESSSSFLDFLFKYCDAPPQKYDSINIFATTTTNNNNNNEQQLEELNRKLQTCENAYHNQRQQIVELESRNKMFQTELELKLRHEAELLEKLNRKDIECQQMIQEVQQQSQQTAERLMLEYTEKKDASNMLEGPPTVQLVDEPENKSFENELKQITGKEDKNDMIQLIQEKFRKLTSLKQDLKDMMRKEENFKRDLIDIMGLENILEYQNILEGLSKKKQELQTELRNEKNGRDILESKFDEFQQFELKLEKLLDTKGTLNIQKAVQKLLSSQKSLLEELEFLKNTTEKEMTEQMKTLHQRLNVLESFKKDMMEKTNGTTPDSILDEVEKLYQENKTLHQNHQDFTSKLVLELKKFIKGIDPTARSLEDKNFLRDLHTVLLETSDNIQTKLNEAQVLNQVDDQFYEKLKDLFKFITDNREEAIAKMKAFIAESQKCKADYKQLSEDTESLSTGQLDKIRNLTHENQKLGDELRNMKQKIQKELGEMVTSALQTSDIFSVHSEYTIDNLENDIQALIDQFKKYTKELSYIVQPNFSTRESIKSKIQSVFENHQRLQSELEEYQQFQTKLEATLRATGKADIQKKVESLTEKELTDKIDKLNQKVKELTNFKNEMMIKTGTETVEDVVKLSVDNMKSKNLIRKLFHEIKNFLLSTGSLSSYPDDDEAFLDRLPNLLSDTVKFYKKLKDMFHLSTNNRAEALSAITASVEKCQYDGNMVRNLQYDKQALEEELSSIKSKIQNTLRPLVNDALQTDIFSAVSLQFMEYTIDDLQKDIQRLIETNLEVVDAVKRDFNKLQDTLNEYTQALSSIVKPDLATREMIQSKIQTVFEKYENLTRHVSDQLTILSNHFQQSLKENDEFGTMLVNIFTSRPHEEKITDLKRQIRSSKFGKQKEELEEKMFDVFDGLESRKSNSDINQSVKKLTRVYSRFIKELEEPHSQAKKSKMYNLEKTIAELRSRPAEGEYESKIHNLEKTVVELQGRIKALRETIKQTRRFGVKRMMSKKSRRKDEMSEENKKLKSDLKNIEDTMDYALKGDLELETMENLFYQLYISYFEQKMNILQNKLSLDVTNLFLNLKKLDDTLEGIPASSLERILGAYVMNDLGILTEKKISPVKHKKDEYLEYCMNETKTHLTEMCTSDDI